MVEKKLNQDNKATLTFSIATQQAFVKVIHNNTYTVNMHATRPRIETKNVINWTFYLLYKNLVT